MWNIYACLNRLWQFGFNPNVCLRVANRWRVEPYDNNLLDAFSLFLLPSNFLIFHSFMISTSKRKGLRVSRQAQISPQWPVRVCPTACRRRRWCSCSSSSWNKHWASDVKFRALWRCGRKLWSENWVEKNGSRNENLQHKVSPKQGLKFENSIQQWIFHLKKSKLNKKKLRL